MGTQDRWVRSQDRWIAGVSGAIAKNIQVETWVVRLIWALAALYFGVGCLFYLSLAVSLPLEGFVHEAYKAKILGVCHEISLRTRVEVGVVRFVALILLVLSVGFTFFAYIILHFVFTNQTQKD